MMNLREILLLKEAFYSCQIEGINEGMTFEQFLKNETVRRSTKNKFKLKGQKRYATREELAENLEGDNKYVGDFWIPHMRAVCTVFNNAPSECSQTLSTSQASAGFGTYNAVVDSKNTHASGSC